MMGRYLILAVAGGLLCVGHAMATSYDTFNVDFYAENGSWNSDAPFTLTSSSTDESTSGFTPNSFCPDNDYWSCVCDPGIQLKVPDQPPPTPFNTSTTFTLSDDGTFDQDYINVGPSIQSFLFTTTDFSDDVTYTCFSAYFKFCGFEITDGTPTLNILFTDPIEPIGTATPEPTQDAFLLIALGAAAMVQRIRARRSNRSSISG